MKKNIIQLIVLVSVVLAIIGGNVGIALNIPAGGEDIEVDILPIDTTDEGDTDEDPEETESAEGDVNVPEVDETEKPAVSEDSGTDPVIVPDTDAPAEPDTTVTVTPPVDEPSVPADTEAPAPVVPDESDADTEAPEVDSTEEAESADVSENEGAEESKEIKEEA